MERPPVVDRDTGEPVRNYDRLDIANPPLHVQAKYNENRASPLLKIPGEIRQMILKLATGSRHVQIECQEPREDSSDKCYAFCYRSTLDRDPPTPYTLSRRLRERVEPLEQMHLTCRQFYLETSLLPFSNHLFSFDRVPDFHGWVQGLLPSQRRAVRRIMLPCSLLIEPCLSDLKLLEGLKILFVVDSSSEYDESSFANRSPVATTKTEVRILRAPFWLLVSEIFNIHR